MLARLVLFIAIAAPLGAQTAATIEALDKAWLKAVLAKDIAALDKMYASDLVYAHASGIVDTKASYLEKLKSGRQVSTDPALK